MIKPDELAARILLTLAVIVVLSCFAIASISNAPPACPTAPYLDIAHIEAMCRQHNIHIIDANDYFPVNYE
jgi:hypothetical protein